MGKKRIYTVATSHLDTIWSWDFETTVSKYIYDTLVDNIALFKKYPTYTFSFEGSYRYELMEEYYPELFEEMKGYIEQGRWNVCGSAFEDGDTSCPSPEALFRNILTTVTTIIPVIVLIFLGSKEILNFNLSLLVGFIAGAYSSIFISNMLWLKLEKRRISQPKKKHDDNDEVEELKVRGINC